MGAVFLMGHVAGNIE